MNRKRTLLLIGTLMAFGACSVSEESLSEFGKTAEATVAIIGLPSQMTGELIAQNEVTRNACRYLNGRSYELASAPGTQKSILLTEQENVVNALDAYAKAISGALDPVAQGKIDAAGNTFAGSASTLAGQVSANAKTVPTLSLLSNAILRIEESRRIADVKAEMQKVLPFLERLRELLVRDQSRVLAEIDQQIAVWDRHTRCVLAANRKKSNAEADFREADRAKRTLLANRQRAGSAVRALDALIDAHFKIVFGETSDFDDGVETLNKFLSQLQAVKDA